MRIVQTLVLTGSLLVTAAAISGATPRHQAVTKKTSNASITCPITHDKVLKSKAIKVTATNGKSTYVCCKDCVTGAKKRLMAQK